MFITSHNEMIVSVCCNLTGPQCCCILWFTNWYCWGLCRTTCKRCFTLWNESNCSWSGRIGYGMGIFSVLTMLSYSVFYLLPFCYHISNTDCDCVSSLKGETIKMHNSYASWGFKMIFCDLLPLCTILGSKLHWTAAFHSFSWWTSMIMAVVLA